MISDVHHPPSRGGRDKRPRRRRTRSSSPLPAAAGTRSAQASRALPWDSFAHDTVDAHSARVSSDRVGFARDGRGSGLGGWCCSAVLHSNGWPCCRLSCMVLRWFVVGIGVFGQAESRKLQHNRDHNKAPAEPLVEVYRAEGMCMRTAVDGIVGWNESSVQCKEAEQRSHAVGRVSSKAGGRRMAEEGGRVSSVGWNAQSRRCPVRAWAGCGLAATSLGWRWGQLAYAQPGSAEAGSWRREMVYAGCSKRSALSSSRTAHCHAGRIQRLQYSYCNSLPLLITLA